MKLKQTLSILLLIFGIVLLAACSNTTSGSPQIQQPDKSVDDPVPLESFNVLETKLTPSDGETSFGREVDIDGDTAIVSINRDSVYIFVNSSTGWHQQAKLTSEPETGAEEDLQSIFSVAISGDTAVMGILDDDDNVSTHIFTRSGTVWTRQVKLTDFTGHQYGIQVDIDGDTVITSLENGDDYDTYIFTRSGTNWIQQTKITYNEDRLSNLGASISGNTIAIGVGVDDSNGANSGAAYILTRSGTTWSEQTKLTASDAAAGEFFGKAVSISGDTVLIGAEESAYVFTRSGTTWNQQAKLVASDSTEYNDSDGLALDGDTAVITASKFEIKDNGSHSVVARAAYIFTRAGTSWTQQAKLTASDEILGKSVSISGSNVIVGDPNNSSFSFPSNEPGAAYIYKLISEEPSDFSTIYVSSSSSGKSRRSFFCQ